jgi:hypothetical protein
MRLSSIDGCAGKWTQPSCSPPLYALPPGKSYLLDLEKEEIHRFPGAMLQTGEGGLMGSRWILAITSFLLLLSGCGIGRSTVRPEIYGQFEKVGPIIFDTMTGLEWQVGPDEDMSWDEARAWVDGLGGNWGMPTREELRGLYDTGIRYDNWEPFENSGVRVWSGEVRESRSAWYFRFFLGGEGRYDRSVSFNARAFAVRSRTGYSPPQTSIEAEANKVVVETNIADEPIALVDGRIYGRVESSDGNPLIGATVMVVDTPWAAMTNTFGEFMIGLPVGSYTLLARMVGMADRTSPVLEIFSGEEVEFNFTGNNPNPDDRRGYSLPPGPGISQITVWSEVHGQFEVVRPAPIIRDTMTGLEWLENPYQDMTWCEAKEWVQSLGGRWRMPTFVELRGLSDAAGSMNSYGAFVLISEFVWSGEMRDSSSVWVVLFPGGPVLSRDPSDARGIRAIAVRSP